MGAISAGAGLLGSLFGSDNNSYSESFVDLRNPQIMEALQMAKGLANSGIDPVTMQRMRSRQQMLASNEIGGARSSAASRLQRQGVPAQIQEQILGDITQKGLFSRLGAEAEMDMFNEQQKLRGLMAYLQGSKGLTQKTTTKGRGPTGQGFSDLFSSGLNLLALGGMDSGGGQNYDYLYELFPGGQNAD